MPIILFSISFESKSPLQTSSSIPKTGKKYIYIYLRTCWWLIFRLFDCSIISGKLSFRPFVLSIHWRFVGNVIACRSRSLTSVGKQIIIIWRKQDTCTLHAQAFGVFGCIIILLHCFEMEQFGPVILFILFHFSYHLQLFDESFDRINEREQTSNLDWPEKTKFIEKEQRTKGA